MKIPVFVSSPTSLSPAQEAARAVIIQQLDDNDLEPALLDVLSIQLALIINERFAPEWSREKHFEVDRQPRVMIVLSFRARNFQMIHAGRRLSCRLLF